MSDFQRQITEAAEAVRLVSPTRYSWMGERSERLPRRVERSLDASSARGYLVYALTNVLYTNFYSQGRATPSRIAATGASPDGDAALVHSLSQANTGHGCWQRGWSVTQRDDRSISVRRNALTLRARPEDCRPAEGGAGLLVRFPNESRRLSPGFYMAMGDAGLDLDEPVVRVYWNISVHGAVPFISAGTRAFNAAGLPVRMKVVNDRGSFDRRDAAVLYLRRQDFARARPLIRALLIELRPALRDGTPALTHRLATGLAVAEDPGGGESFGLHRCALIAEGLVRGAESGRPAVEAVEHVLTETGVNPTAPYLSPGSTQQYALR